MRTKSSVLEMSDIIAKKAKEANLTYLILTGSVNSGNNSESSDFDFVFDYNKDHFIVSKLYDFEDELSEMLGAKVHLLSLRGQEPEVLINISKNFEVILDET